MRGNRRVKGFPVPTVELTVALSTKKALPPLNQVGNTPGMVVAALLLWEMETSVALIVRGPALPTNEYGCF